MPSFRWPRRLTPRCSARRCFLVALLFAGATCRAPGPTVERLPEAPFDLPGVGTTTGASVWRFVPAHTDWKGDSVAELVLARRSSLRAVARFEMRLLGRNAGGALRLKTWQGTVSRSGDVLDLHADRCHVFGKRKATDRLVPLERWDCDHLVLQFHIEGARLQRVHADSDRTKRTEWLRLESVDLMTRFAAGNGKAPTRGAKALSPVWVGQRLQGEADKGETVYFGHEAERHVRAGDALLLLDPHLQPAGRAKVTAVVGDFVIARDATNAAPLAGALVSHRPAGLLD